MNRVELQVGITTATTKKCGYQKSVSAAHNISSLRRERGKQHQQQWKEKWKYANEMNETSRCVCARALRVCACMHPLHNDFFSIYRWASIEWIGRWISNVQHENARASICDGNSTHTHSHHRHQLYVSTQTRKLGSACIFNECFHHFMQWMYNERVLYFASQSLLAGDKFVSISMLLILCESVCVCFILSASSSWSALCKDFILYVMPSTEI